MGTSRAGPATALLLALMVTSASACGSVGDDALPMWTGGPLAMDEWPSTAPEAPVSATTAATSAPAATAAPPEPAPPPEPPPPPAKPPEPAPPTDACDDPVEPGDVVWIDTPVITHDRDFHSLSDWVDPAVPADWTSPVDYAGGEMTVCVQLVSLPDPAALPVYYTVGWDPGDGSDSYIRMGTRFDAAPEVERTRLAVTSFQRVVDGYDAGDVGDQWDWTQAFSSPNGDTWGAVPPYPLQVRLRVTLHPA